MVLVNEIISITNISCGSCASKISQIFQNDPNVKSVKVNTFLKQLLIIYDNESMSLSTILSLLSKHGFISEYKHKRDNFLYTAIIIFFIYRIIPFLLENNISILYLTILICMIYQGNIFLFMIRKGSDLRYFIMMGAFITYLFGVFIFIFSFETGFFYLKISNSISCFLLVGRLVENHIRDKNLRDMNLQRSNLFHNVEKYKRDDLFVSIDMINVGDKITVLKNVYIPVDGILLSDFTFVDESSLTGESCLVYKEKGSLTYAGTINIIKDAIILVKKIEKNTLKGEILSLIQNSFFVDENRKIKAFACIIFYYALSVMIFHYILLILNIKSKILYDTDYPFFVPIKVFLSVIVVSCPCALSLCEPTLFLLLSNVFRKHGIIMKDTGSIKKKIDLVVFDKTGTLTNGFTVENIQMVNNNTFLDNHRLEINDIYYLLKVIQKDVDHPIAKAIYHFCLSKEYFEINIDDSTNKSQCNKNEAIKCDNIIENDFTGINNGNINNNISTNEFEKLNPMNKKDVMFKAKNINNIITETMKFNKNNHINESLKEDEYENFEYKKKEEDYIKVPTNKRLKDSEDKIIKMKDCCFNNGYIKAEKIEYEYVSGTGIKGILKINNNLVKFKIEKNNEVYIFSLNKKPTVQFTISEIIRKEAIDTIKEIYDKKIQIIMLTGDTKISAKKIAEKVGITKYYHSASSKMKYEIINEYQKKGIKVLMVGDGINDLPALKKADIGICTKTLNDQISFTLLNENLLNIPLILKLTTKVNKRIRLCYSISILYNLIGILIASGFFLKMEIFIEPEESCLSMFLSSMVVIFISSSINLR